MIFRAAGYFRSLKIRVEELTSDELDAVIKHYVGEAAWKPISAALGHDRLDADYRNTIAKGMVLGLCLARSKIAYEALVKQRNLLEDYFTLGLKYPEGGDAGEQG